MFPTLIYDNFFDNPDRVVDYANSLEFIDTDTGAWPGKRTNDLSQINPQFKNEVVRKILGTFYPNHEYQYFAKLIFQKITPFHEDKYHIKNRGWIHRDQDRCIGGIIYLNKNPEPDTGTSIYKNKCLTDPYFVEHEQCKRNFYLGKYISDEYYEKHFLSTPENFQEVIRVENVYNRLMMFNGNQYHGVHTYGSSNTERLTLAFFISYVASNNIQPPLLRV